jgi:death-on-curing protein
VVDTVQHDMINVHGGLPGLRDEALLESALARPRQLWSYGERTEIADLAAAYAVGIARDHPYHDGNKRIAFVAMAVFAELNGFEFDAPEAEVVEMMLRLAAGTIEDDELTVWVRRSLRETGH